VTFARPVRTLASSLRKSSTAFSIRVRACADASFTLMIVLIAILSRSSPEIPSQQRFKKASG
jgi:hypothetical protein